MDGVGRRELRFGLLGPPVLYDGHGYDVHGVRDVRDGHGGVGDAGGKPDAPGSVDVVKAIGSPKVRTLLAALLLEAGRVVSVESLKDALWGGAPPASAQASLHNHVARLRRLLDDPERLRAVPPGYVLRSNRTSWTSMSSSGISPRHAARTPPATGSGWCASARPRSRCGGARR